MLTPEQEKDPSILGSKANLAYAPTTDYNPNVRGGSLANASLLSKPDALSTTQAADALAQTHNTLASISGPTTPTKPASMVAPANPTAITPYNPPASGSTAQPAPAKPAGGVKFLNLDNQEVSLEGDNLTPEAYQKLLDQGYFAIESSGSVPSWATTGDITSGRQQAQAQADTAKAQKELDDMKAKLTASLSATADPATLKAITDLYDSRIQDMQKINDSRVSNINTLGIRLGDRYTGGKGGMFGGIITEEERQGATRITQLESEKRQAIDAANQAAKSQNWTAYSKFVDLAETKYKESQATLKDLNDKAIKNSEALAEKAGAAARDTAIADLYSQGVTNPAQILSELNANGGNYTLKDIADGVKNLIPSGLDDIVKTAGANGAPPDVIKSILSSADLSSAYAAAGSYVQGGSGIVGEYQFYKRQAEAAGQTPVDFNEYQNLDANRKAKVAAAATASGLDNATLTKVQNVARQFDNEQSVKNYQVVAEGKSFLDSIADDTKNPADQQGVIYAFAKIMDPNSVVREGEYNTVQKYAQSWADTFGFDAKRIFSNSPFLTSEAVKNMKATISSKVAASEKSYDNIYKEYGRRINKITGKGDGTDFITNYKNGYGQTGNDIINSESQAEQKMTDFGDTNETERQRILQMRKDGVNWIDIQKYYNQ